MGVAKVAEIFGPFARGRPQVGGNFRAVDGTPLAGVHNVRQATFSSLD